MRNVPLERSVPVEGWLRIDPRLVLVAIVAAALIGCNAITGVFMSTQAPPEDQSGLVLADLPPGSMRVVAEGLEVPWDLVFLPDGHFLVTERAGRLLRFPPWRPGEESFRPEDAEIWEVPDVRSGGEGGLMGIALHPDFGPGATSGPGVAPESSENRWVYLMWTYEGASGPANRIDRFWLAEDGLSRRTTILEGIPGGSFHDGGRIRFGPDGYLYATTGDAGDPSRAQDPTSLAAKILRMTDLGAAAPENPFQTRTWSLGHRNPQGLAFGSDGTLWVTEHGRSGLQSGLDELNYVRAGENYGWPEIEGDETDGDLVPPVIHSGPDYTWAPAGLARLDDRLFFGGLRGEALYEARAEGDGVNRVLAHFAGELGRIRSVVAGPDGMLWVSTSNRDGRGRPREGDDRIIRIEAAAFRE